ncbi:uncharacterized protein TrAFT101_003125 [Trichoderma asperellum]|uniref:uncharacterized protein n=1 Tax=Trichoderma asperellum TaxID=101201 RepID=UPI00331C42A3|nr:hypothetical protein TrAFT101_003125 [Trichoderma asperellum]
MPRDEVPWGETNERFMITIQQLVVRGFATEHHASAAEPDLNMAALNPAFANEQIRGGFRPRSGVSMGLETRRHVSASSQCLRRYELVRTSGGRLACILSNQRSKAARLKGPLAQLGLASRKSPKSQQMPGCA